VTAAVPPSDEPDPNETDEDAATPALGGPESTGASAGRNGPARTSSARSRSAPRAPRSGAPRRPASPRKPRQRPSVSMPDDLVVPPKPPLPPVPPVPAAEAAEQRAAAAHDPDDAVTGDTIAIDRDQLAQARQTADPRTRTPPEAPAADPAEPGAAPAVEAAVVVEGTEPAVVDVAAPVVDDGASEAEAVDAASERAIADAEADIAAAGAVPAVEAAVVVESTEPTVADTEVVVEGADRAVEDVAAPVVDGGASEAETAEGEAADALAGGESEREASAESAVTSDAFEIVPGEPEGEVADAVGADDAADPDAAAAEAASKADAVVARGLTKIYGGVRAVDGIDLTVPAGVFYGLVGPNGAGKTTTLSILSGLLAPDAGTLRVAGVDATARPRDAKRLIGVLPDRLRTFDRLTGRQLLYYCGVLRGLDSSVVESRSADLARAFDLVDALGRPVSDYSAGMTKKIMLAGAMIHSPRVLVLDEPFEAVDPVSSSVILDILSAYVDHGGTVVLSSHGIDLVERVCSVVAVLVSGHVLAEGSVDEVRGGLSLEERYVELAGGSGELEGLEWLHTFSD